MQFEMPVAKSNHRFAIYGVIFFLLSFTLGFFAAKIWDVRSAVQVADGAEAVTVVGLYGKSQSKEVSFDEFWQVWDKVKSKYVNQPVNDSDLFYGAIAGMVAGLGDQHSIFFPPPKAQEFSSDLAGEFDGIGAEIGIHDNQLTVIEPLPGSPAEKAGLKSGDKIYSIDGTDTATLQLEEAVKKIRGKKGTTVTLRISHSTIDASQDLKIVRGTITVPTVMEEMKDNSIAYIRISYFDKDTWSDFDKMVGKLVLKAPKGIVLDMRSNPGGYLDAAVNVASEWIRTGVVVREQFIGNQKNEYQSQGSHRLAGIPTVILVDGGTASGAEIVAGALQDYGLATLVGTKTYGKGSVQDYEDLPDGSALKLTIAKWLTPKGRQIDKEGIPPDVTMDKMFDDAGVKDGKPVKDLGLAKAIELLQKEIKK